MNEGNPELAVFIGAVSVFVIGFLVAFLKSREHGDEIHRLKCRADSLERKFAALDRDMDKAEENIKALGVDIINLDGRIEEASKDVYDLKRRVDRLRLTDSEPMDEASAQS